MNTCRCGHQRSGHYDRFGNYGNEDSTVRYNCGLCECDEFSNSEWDDEGSVVRSGDTTPCTHPTLGAAFNAAGEPVRLLCPCGREWRVLPIEMKVRRVEQ